jgi:hypothetical protein
LFALRFAFQLLLVVLNRFESAIATASHRNGQCPAMDRVAVNLLSIVDAAIPPGTDGRQYTW